MIESDHKQYDIFKILVVSTAHLPRDEADKLTAQGLQITQDVYGYQVYACHTDDYEDTEFPVEIRNLTALARDLDCKYLRFDRDGPTLPDFPVFDW